MSLAKPVNCLHFGFLYNYFIQCMRVFDGFFDLATSKLFLEVFKEMKLRFTSEKWTTGCLGSRFLMQENPSQLTTGENLINERAWDIRKTVSI